MGWRVIPIILFIALSISFWRGLFLEPHQIPSAQIGKTVPIFTAPLLQKPTSLFSSAQLPHQIILLNVWASWCEACIEEQVFMLQLAQEGVLIYGLNYKDNAEHAMQWLNKWGNPYRLIAQDNDGKIAMDLGVYGTPETFVIDKYGVIRHRHVGIMNQTVWTEEIEPLIKKLE